MSSEPILGQAAETTLTNNRLDLAQEAALRSPREVARTRGKTCRNRTPDAGHHTGRTQGEAFSWRQRFDYLAWVESAWSFAEKVLRAAE